MPSRIDATAGDLKACRWISLHEALHHFATFTGKTTSQKHIKPLHWYVACRLVLEGGFDPDEVTPHPPFRLEKKAGRFSLVFDPSVATAGERTILGGLKTKNVDVVVTKEGIGPVLAVSCKGMTKAFRNLTNRMEETIGECTNLHITYPALVFGYMFVFRANKTLVDVATAADEDDGADDDDASSSDADTTTTPSIPPAIEAAPPASSSLDVPEKLAPNDIAIKGDGQPVETIARFHKALCEMTGRRGIRNDVSRYEAISLGLIEPSGGAAGEVLSGFPPAGSPILLDTFFQTLYQRYEERFVLGAPDLIGVTGRREWETTSPLLTVPGPDLDYPARLALPRAPKPRKSATS